MKHSRFFGILLAVAYLAGPAPASGPKVDPKQIINESNSFLKEKEPEMTEEEYALYQKVVSMLGTNPAFAIKLLESMASGSEPISPAFEFILANAYYAAGQTDKSEARYRSAVKRFPTFLRAWVNLGVLYYSSGRYGEAVPCFSKAVELGDRDSSTFGLLGYSLQKRGDLVSAEMAYMQALSGDPSNMDWKEGLLAICIDAKQFTRAESLVRNLIKDAPSDSRYWLTYANILLMEGRKLEATVLLEVAVGTGATNTEELSTLGDLYAEQDLMSEAANIYAKLLAENVELGAKKLLHYSQVLLASGRIDEAEKVLAACRIPAGDKAELDLLQTRADLDTARHSWASVHKDLDSLLSLDPLNGRALITLGRTYESEDDVPHATLAFEEATRILGSAYVACLELANIELKNRHYAQCVQYLERALNIERTDAVQDFLARVKTLVPRDS
ncbi:MAG TPA: tetratricopeptide repeat protein [Opitutaceae bacterium]|jgi:tetratricopeptide (TPR) repeat protein